MRSAEKLFERAIATAFTQFAGQIRRFDQRIQAGGSRGYIAERIQRTRISYDFGNATDAESDHRFSVEHRLKNAQAEAFVFGCVESSVSCRKQNGRIDDALLTARHFSERPNSPAYFHFLEAQCWAEKQNWERAWNAWQAFQAAQTAEAK